jgi:hypothetical protein
MHLRALLVLTERALRRRYVSPETEAVRGRKAGDISVQVMGKDFYVFQKYKIFPFQVEKMDVLSPSSPASLLR